MLFLSAAVSFYTHRDAPQSTVLSLHVRGREDAAFLYSGMTLESLAFLQHQTHKSGRQDQRQV
jgi:hypothetical protein